MGKALYRKYRSKKLSEIVGQEHITTTLDHAIKQGRISHAYLFTGPRGVGKTSIARILAHEINELPYTDESYHLDIIEIDAASNRRIDEIRDLRDKVHTAPSSAAYKVYIIDEVHMLTKEAFNALLKTLEEPPSHVVFILATTESHKLPETIISRTQHFSFKPIDATKAVEHLRSIAKDEGMTIDDDALQLLALHGNGSFRDSISLLDQVASAGTKKISRSEVETIIGLAPRELVDALVKSTLDSTPAAIVDSLDKLKETGISPGQAAKQLSAAVRDRLLSGNNTDPSILGRLLERLYGVTAAPDPTASLELALFEASLSSDPQAQAPTVAPKPVVRAAAAPPAATHKVEPKQTRAAKAESEEPKKPVVSDEPADTVTESEAPQDAVEPSDQAPTSSADVQDIQAWWPDALMAVKKQNNTLYGILRMADASLTDKGLLLTFSFGFHQKRLSEAENQKKVKTAIMEVTGQNLHIKTAVNAELKVTPGTARTPSITTVTVEPAPAENAMSAITNIFGGAEILET